MISIIIIVKNDREIENTLNSLDETKKPEKTEIIVVDASKKETLLDIKKKFPKVIWFYYENKTEKKITIPEQRNMGIKKSNGRIIIFVDAGCVVEKNWLIELIKPIKNDNEYFVTGLVKSKDKNSFHNSHWVQRKNREYISECGTANAAFKKEIINTAGLFDESFDYGSDTEFSWRVIESGFKIRYTQQAVIYHNWGDLGQDIKRAIRYGEARVRIYKKHHLRPSSVLKRGELFTLYSFGLFVYIISIIPLSIFFLWYPLLILIPLIKNIKYSPIKKMIFDFFHGFGVLKELFFPPRVKK